MTNAPISAEHADDDRSTPSEAVLTNMPVDDGEALTAVDGALADDRSGQAPEEA